MWDAESASGRAGETRWRLRRGGARAKFVLGRVPASFCRRDNSVNMALDTERRQRRVNALFGQGHEHTLVE